MTEPENPQRPRVPDFTAPTPRTNETVGVNSGCLDPLAPWIITDTFGDQARVGTCTVVEDDLEYVQLSTHGRGADDAEAALVLGPASAVQLADALIKAALRTATIRFGNLRVCELAAQAETILQTDD